MPDLFQNFSSGLESPATHLEGVTPSDTNDLTHFSRAINVAVSGQVRMTTVGGTNESVQVAAGVAFPVRAQRIWQTGTTASGIVVMY